MSTGKTDYRTWIELTTTDPDTARAVWEAGDVDVPPHIARQLQANREFRPLGSGQRSAFAPSENRPDPQDASGERFEQQHATTEQQAEASTERLTGAEWSRLSEVDPEAAIAAHREGRVDFEPHIARQLEANRSFRPIGG